jgi:hypothetical protein
MPRNSDDRHDGPGDLDMVHRAGVLGRIGDRPIGGRAPTIADREPDDQNRDRECNDTRQDEPGKIEVVDRAGDRRGASGKKWQRIHDQASPVRGRRERRISVQASASAPSSMIVEAARSTVMMRPL